ncbi:hypothetical protein L2E82_30322 [Cichorium intybus]|uniref:Uncharacterized protein n=1 Tax=Cichorium intybus TaxID=13427 RepID=A0ACB9D0D6_CICIN|nr:hypothetical protein L2E82_30322 [Cichorium intybus]
MSNPHVLLVSRHDYDHLNPTIELAKNFRLVDARVTVATTVSCFYKLKFSPSLHLISCLSISDGHDDDINAGLPLFKWSDFPTFVLPTSPYFSDMLSVCQEHLQILEDDPNPYVLIKTMDGLEPESLKSIANAVVVGPLVPSSLSSSEGAYFKWLDSKPENSVIYVSFGSTAVLSKAQKEEIQNLKT